VILAAAEAARKAYEQAEQAKNEVQRKYDEIKGQLSTFYGTACIYLVVLVGYTH